MNERILDLIKKLIRHERSAHKCSTPEEAAAFAAKIQHLCIEHKIAAEQIDLSDDESSPASIGEEVFSPYRKRYRGRGVYVTREDSRLMYVVSVAHFCQAVVIAETNCVLVVGEEQDRAVAIAMFQYLRRVMRAAAAKEEAAQLKRRRPVRKFRYYFTLGFIRTIDERYQALRAAADNTTTALVRADAMVRRYVTDKFELKSAPKRKPKGRMNLDAMFAGCRTAHQANLSTAVVNGGSQNNKALSTGC